MKQVMAKGGDRVGLNLAAIAEIRAIAAAESAEFILAMTPLLREIGEPGPRDYELKARRRLSLFTETEQIPYIDFLPIFQAVQQPEGLYRDHIHLSPTGNRLCGETLSK